MNSVLTDEPSIYIFSAHLYVLHLTTLLFQTHPASNHIPSLLSRLVPHE